MTAVTPGLTVPDSQILALLRQIVAIGAHKGTWAYEDVRRVCRDHLTPLVAHTQPAAPEQPDDWDGTRTVTLTARRAQVLDALRAGHTTSAQIAAAVGIGETTARCHARDLVKALGAATRTEAVSLVDSGQIRVRVGDGRRDRRRGAA